MKGVHFPAPEGGVVRGGTLREGHLGSRGDTNYEGTLVEKFTVISNKCIANVL